MGMDRQGYVFVSITVFNKSLPTLVTIVLKLKGKGLPINHSFFLMKHPKMYKKVTYYYQYMARLKENGNFP